MILLFMALLISMTACSSEESTGKKEKVCRTKILKKIRANLKIGMLRMDVLSLINKQNVKVHFLPSDYHKKRRENAERLPGGKPRAGPILQIGLMVLASLGLLQEQ